MHDKVNELQTKYLAKNNYFAVSTYGKVYRRDTWESYGFCENLVGQADFIRWRDIISDVDCAQWSEQAENFINQLDKPEDWQRPHRFCLARYARKILEDDNFREDLVYNKDIDDEYIYRYTIISRLKETALIKKLNLLPDEEKKQLFILRDWEKKAYACEDVFYAVCGRESFYDFLYNKEIVKKDYEKYMKELEDFKIKDKLF
ncbi:hypothetical protein [Snodgrassella communis]|uniref:hypothetical protein n=1 Tax=Snodgrassella communis TaxID=2946699 RepID=UPI001EF73C5B|nr:hypothetical protein [Snodgrassella communis]